MRRAHRDEERPARGAVRGALPRNATVRRYVLPGETVVVEQHEHWARVLEPVASAAVGFVVACMITNSIAGSIGSGIAVVWFAWAALALRCLWILLKWRFRWFVATDKRLLLIYGLITHRVAMMPLVKVTDMNYDRTLLGELLGYGRFLMESAGQDQALRKVDFVRQPNETYETLCDTLFGKGPSGRPRIADYDDAPGGWPYDDEPGDGGRHGDGRRDRQREPLAGGSGRDLLGTQPVPLPAGDTQAVPTVPPPPSGPTPPAVPPRRRRITPSSERTQVVGPPTDPAHRERTRWPRRHDRFDVYSEPPGPGWDVSDEERGSFIPIDPDQR